MISEQWFGKDIKGSGHGLVYERSTNQTFAWRNWGTPHKTSVRIVGLLDKILTQDLLNMKSTTWLWKDSPKNCIIIKPVEDDTSLKRSLKRWMDSVFITCYTPIWPKDDYDEFMQSKQITGDTKSSVTWNKLAALPLRLVAQAVVHPVFKGECQVL
jgi:hypothetical protein